MTTYAIGDLQGCLDPLQRLLDQIHFEPMRDQLWFAGDLVNRGPQSLETLRFVRQLGSSATSVLGNHDLHLLAAAHGRRPGRRDTLDKLLCAPDRAELLDWLRQQPLLVESADGKIAMLHAGLPPQWSIAQARICAREVESALRGPDYAKILYAMYGNEPDIWSEQLTGAGRLRFIINCFTRLRYCDAQGRLKLEPNCAPGTQPPGLQPWFEVPGRLSADTTIIFGHWSTLGKIHWPEQRVFGLDTGCVWGGALTAINLEDFSVHSASCSP